VILHRPEFSPASCYLLRDQAEVDYFTECGGAPEAGLITWARSLIKPEESFVDVGAHVGSWAQDLVQHCFRAVAFEPQPSTYERLVQGTLHANLADRVTCRPLALGREAGTVSLAIVSADGGGSTVKHRAELGAVLETNLVSITPLDAAIHPDSRIGLIKLDVEGNEADVIAGAARMIAEHRPTILAEAWLHEWYADERLRLRRLLESLGYTVDIVPGWPEMLWAVPS
jgi:FkbM family methyltransferase